MISSGKMSPLVGSAARRRRALAHLSPVFDLHLSRNRNPSNVDWAAYDFIALIQQCVDTVALLSGLDGSLGTPRAAVLTEMTRAAAAMGLLASRFVTPGECGTSWTTCSPIPASCRSCWRS